MVCANCLFLLVSFLVSVCLWKFVHSFYVVQFVGICSHDLLYFCYIGYSSSFISYFVYLIPFSFLLGEIPKIFSFFKSFLKNQLLDSLIFISSFLSLFLKIPLWSIFFFFWLWAFFVLIFLLVLSGRLDYLFRDFCLFVSWGRCFCCLVAKTYLTLVALWTVACQASLSMDFPDKNTSVDYHFLLHWQADSLVLSHQISPWERPTMKFPLRIAFVHAIVSFVFAYFLISPLISSLKHCFFCSLLFNLHIFILSYFS